MAATLASLTLLARVVFLVSFWFCSAPSMVAMVPERETPFAFADRKPKPFTNGYVCSAVCRKRSHGGNGNETRRIQSNRPRSMHHTADDTLIAVMKDYDERYCQRHRNGRFSTAIKSFHCGIRGDACECVCVVWWEAAVKNISNR